MQSVTEKKMNHAQNVTKQKVGDVVKLKCEIGRDQQNTHCHVCGCELTEENTNRWSHSGEIRLDSMGYRWCNTCTDKFDSIDWDAERSDDDGTNEQPPAEPVTCD